MTLRERAIAGFRWSATAHGVQHIVQLLTTIALVAMLTPADFGLIGMATVFTALARLFHDLGTATALVQRHQVSEKLLSSVFWTTLGLGLLATASLVLVSPFVADYYGDARVQAVLGVLAIAFALSGTSVVQGALLQRRFAFRAIAAIDVTSVLISSVVALAAAASGAGVWSLVAQTLTAAAVKSIGLWAACAWRPHAVFSWTELRSVLAFSLNLTGFSLFNHFARHAGALLIGRYLGATQLGYYTLAYRLMLYPIQNLTTVVNRVTMPVYARLQDDNRRLRAAFLRVSAAIATLSCPVMIGLAVVGDLLIAAAFGPRWEPAGLLITILAPVGLLQSLVNPLGNIYKAKDRTGVFFAWGVLMGLLVIAAAVVGVQFGVAGVAIGYAAVSFAMVYPSCAIPFRFIDLSVPVFVTRLHRPLACSLAMGLVVLIMRTTAPDTLSSGTALTVLVAAGVTTYALLTLFFNRDQLREMLQVARINTA